MSKPDTIVYRYVGKDGEHHVGIPVRDLTAEDVDALPPLQKRDLNFSALYKAVGTPAASDADTGKKGD